ncbi:hypothetical protein I79_007967 [Cricetulus griseus]|uniref:Uncharacterized protein n=1 Tax=Cricetulus griseus TaxID=10029 RepID=G3HBR0_CRIGR|nr:hypothetical protein I79_007967 [Cricetulus griseus]
MPSWARRTSPEAAVNVTSSHCAQASGCAVRAHPSLRQVCTSATEKYRANSSKHT